MENLLLYLSEIIISTILGFLMVTGILLFFYRSTEARRQQQSQAREAKQKKVDAPFHENLIRLAKRTQRPLPEHNHPEKQHHQNQA